MPVPVGDLGTGDLRQAPDIVHGEDVRFVMNAEDGTSILLGNVGMCNATSRGQDPLHSKDARISGVGNLGQQDWQIQANALHGGLLGAAGRPLLSGRQAPRDPTVAGGLSDTNRDAVPVA